MKRKVTQMTTKARAARRGMAVLAIVVLVGAYGLLKVSSPAVSRGKRLVQAKPLMPSNENKRFSGDIKELTEVIVTLEERIKKLEGKISESISCEPQKGIEKASETQQGNKEVEGQQ